MTDDTKDTDPFLKTMTFMNGRRLLPSCDCDECEVNRVTVIPEPIRRAVQNHKRARKLTRSQLRELVHRGRNVVLWRWTLPINAEPLIEYGNPDVHRLIWVKRLAPRTSLKSIGIGVIGSASEGDSRITMPWVQGSVVHVESQSSKAVGWVSVSSVVATDIDADEPTTDHTKACATPIVLYIAKVSLAEGSIDEDKDERLETIRNLCFRYKSRSDGPGGNLLSTADTASFQRAFGSFLGFND